jgi:hypothetical protein
MDIDHYIKNPVDFVHDLVIDHDTGRPKPFQSWQKRSCGVTEEELKKTKLKECPFCGDSPSLFFGLNCRATGHGECGDNVGVVCQCGASITESSYAGHDNTGRAMRAIEKWNNRKQQHGGLEVQE